MSRNWLIWAGCGLMVLIGGYLLWINGFTRWLSYSMLLLCPLMHLLMMGGMHHGHHNDHDHEQDAPNRRPDSNAACH